MAGTALETGARAHCSLQERAVRAATGPWSVLAAVAAGAVWVAAVDPNEPGHYPLCPIRAMTGLYCPGCGALRATHALTHGDFGAALGFNVLFVLALPWIAAMWLVWARRHTLGLPRRWLAPAWVLWAFLAVELVFTVLRNLPGFEILAP